MKIRSSGHNVGLKMETECNEFTVLSDIRQFLLSCFTCNQKTPLSLNHQCLCVSKRDNRQSQEFCYNRPTLKVNNDKALHQLSCQAVSQSQVSRIKDSQNCGSARGTQGFLSDRIEYDLKYDDYVTLQTAWRFVITCYTTHPSASGTVTADVLSIPQIQHIFHQYCDTRTTEQLEEMTTNIRVRLSRFWLWIKINWNELLIF